MLGERYGIPTEFTSYLVVEPRVAMAPGAVGGAMPASAAPSAVADRSMRFESAKAASAQRAASTVAAVDSISAAGFSARRVAGVAVGERAASTRVVNGHTFVLRDGVWTDARGEVLRLGPAPYLSDTQLQDAIALLGEAARER